MDASMTSLLGFTAWALVLLMVVVAYRSWAVLAGRHRANDWPRGTPPADDPGLVVRAQHAHLNTLETLPLFAAVVLVAAVTGNTALTDPLAPYVLAARVAQSVVHLMGVTHWLVQARFAFFLVQVALIAYMILRLL